MTRQLEIEKLRRYKGITQKEMAQMIGVTERSYIHKITGASQFKLSEMLIIRNLLEKPLDEIFLEQDFATCE